MLKIQGKPETVSKTFRLPKELAQNLDRIASKNNTSLNNVIIQCLNYAFSEISIEDEEKLDEDIYAL